MNRIVNPKVDCFVMNGTDNVNAFKSSDCCNNLYLICGENQQKSSLASDIIYADSLWSTRTIQRIASVATAKYTLICMYAETVEIAPNALERMLNIAEDASAGMIYSDYYVQTDEGLIKHPLIDYRNGSLRNDFDFGAFIICRTDILKNLTVKLEECRYAAFYDFRLKASHISRIVHINEYLYTLTKKEICLSSEKLFDYVDPKNREVQIEMERICTLHLKAVNAYLPPLFSKIDLDVEKFETEASVIIPVRNRVNTIEDAIHSALGQQTDFPFNIIIINNHSTDGTTEIINKFAADPRLIHIIPTRKDLGIGGCWNEAIAHHRCGKFAVQLDSDDAYSDKHVLKKIISAFYQQNVPMIIGTYQMTNIRWECIPPGIIDHKEWTHENGRNNALRINGLGAPRAFFVPLLRRLKFPNTSYGEDYAIGLRISRQYAIGRLHDVLYLCRRWGGNSDAQLNIQTENEYNVYKDNLRTWELEARIQLNKNTARTANLNYHYAIELLERQKKKWEMLKTNFISLENVQTKRLNVGNLSFTVQLNPARIKSSAVEIKKAFVVSSQSCFLCQPNLPDVQEHLEIDDNFILLCNPYPIFPEHFVIAHKQHIPQSISEHFPVLLKASKSLFPLTIFYNGPKSGASAPAHLHFQAVSPSYMSIESEIDEENVKTLTEISQGRIRLLANALRSGFIIDAETEDAASMLFRHLYDLLTKYLKAEDEPMMNLFCQFSPSKGWTLILIPRKKHRPSQFYVQDASRVVVSPGAADIGGLLITAGTEDFHKMDVTLIADIFRQICYSETELGMIIENLKSNPVYHE
ncbi:MAG: DUF4922 domain-containing protein [Tannerellaceae bacterium]|jgi:glycosyltransferase involved in cell wall biosynthesis|nr:DUF4922 domain-containing protein [Tannerellaceae bacterium]